MDSKMGKKSPKEVPVVLPILKFPVIKIIQSFQCRAELVKNLSAFWGQQQSSVIMWKSDVAADCFVAS